VSGHEFHVIWDVAEDANTFSLAAEAQLKFPAMAEDAGVRLTGPVSFHRPRPDRFVAVAPAERDRFAGRRPPWEDEDDYRADLVDPASWIGAVA
jgi:hypothetical protein